MFRKLTVEPIFSQKKLNGFGFDMEILYLARKLGYRIKEGPVSWHHVDGSKIKLFPHALKMFFNIFKIKYWHG